MAMHIFFIQKVIEFRRQIFTIRRVAEYLTAAGPQHIARHRRDIAYADFGISAMRHAKLLERAVMRMLKNHFRSSVYLKRIFEAVAAARRIRVSAICFKVRDLKFTKKI